VEPGAEAALLADVVDSAFVEVNDARVVATVTGPSGRPVEVPMLWTGRRNGEYRASLVSVEPGLHEIRVEAVKAGVPLGVAAGHVRVGAGDSEYFDAGMRAPLLQRIAQETGGRFYRSEDASALAEDIAYAGRGVTTVEERDLWTCRRSFSCCSPRAGEWGYRRARRLA